MDHRAAVAELIAAYPRDRIGADTAQLYTTQLAEIPPDALGLAIRELICTRERFPTIASIRLTLAEQTLQLPAEAEALTAIEARMRSPISLHPLVERVFALMGGVYSYRASDAPDVFRGQFLRLYRDERARTIRQAQIAPPTETRHLTAVSS